MMKLPNLRNLAKYFLHGIAFTALVFVLTLFSAFLLVILAIVGSFIGIIIGLVILVILVGFANALITETLWFKLETSWENYPYQGILLLILLGIVGLPLRFFYNQVTGLPTVSAILAALILFIAESLIYGFIGKRVGSIWRLPEPDHPSTLRRTPTPTFTTSQRTEPVVPVETKTTTIAPGSPEELNREEAKLELLLKHRQKTDLLNPEALDNLIETQKRIVQNLRKALTGQNQ